MKTCTKCHVEQPLNNFSKHRGGLRPSCKACAAAYRADNLEELRAKEQTWRENNRESEAARVRAYRAKLAAAKIKEDAN